MLDKVLRKCGLHLASCTECNSDHALGHVVILYFRAVPYLGMVLDTLLKVHQGKAIKHFNCLFPSNSLTSETMFFIHRTIAERG